LATGIRFWDESKAKSWGPMRSIGDWSQRVLAAILKLMACDELKAQKEAKAATNLGTPAGMTDNVAILRDDRRLGAIVMSPIENQADSSADRDRRQSAEMPGRIGSLPNSSPVLIPSALDATVIIATFQRIV
jgi:hypothetical protein